MKSLLMTATAVLFAMSQMAMAEDKAVTTTDVIEKIIYAKDEVRLLLEDHKKKGEFGCKDPYYVVSADAFGSAFSQVIAVVTEAAVYHAEIALTVSECSDEDKDGMSVVSEVGVDLGGQYDGRGHPTDRPGSFR